MALDSTANLLFSIDADPSAATGNIAKFRNLLTKDLGDIGAEFSSWSTKVFGNLTTGAGVATAGLAALAAGAAAVGAAFYVAGQKYVEYAGEISKGMKLTGLHAEQMSVLYQMAHRTGVEYDSLLTGIARFASTIVKASEGNDVAKKSFANLGISQADVIAGQKDLYPLLLKTMDGFHNNTSAVQRAAEARDLFGRGGTAMLSFLGKGSEGLAHMREEAAALGTLLNDQDIWEARQFKIAMKELKAHTEALELTMGKATMGLQERWAALRIALWDGFKTMSGGFDPQSVLSSYFEGVAASYTAAMAKIKQAMKASGTDDETPPIVEPEKLAAAKENWYGISSIIESLQGKIAGTGDATERLNQEMQHYQFEVGKATEELTKLRAEGKLSAEASERETALLNEVPQLLATLGQRTREKILEAQIIAKEKEEEALAEAHQSLSDRLAQYDSQDYAQQRAHWTREMDALQVQMEKKAALTTAEYALLAQIRAAGNEKIHRDQQQAFLQEMGGLQAQMAQMVLQTMSSRARLEFEYQRDLVAFSEVEEQKALNVAQSEAEQQAIHELYARNRALLLQRYQLDLQALVNSQGWKGVFGEFFAAAIRRNEALTKEWATSAHQSVMMVRIAMESLKESAQQAFGTFAQGMGQGIAQAVIYSKSIGQAMRAALVATLESLAGQALVQAIYATGLGFLRLALGDPAGAAAAFTAAAFFGIVGGAAALVGRAIAPKQDAAVGASGGSGGALGGGAAAGASGGDSGSGTGRKQTVQIYVYGHVIGRGGAAELVDIINSQVVENDTPLVASHNTAGERL